MGVAVGKEEEEEEKVAMCSCGSKYRAVGGSREHVNAPPVRPCLDTFTQVRQSVCSPYISVISPCISLVAAYLPQIENG